MEYNEYKAPEGKVLFNTDDFTYGNTILSMHNLNLIVLDKEQAEQLQNEYNAKQEEASKMRESLMRAYYEQEQETRDIEDAEIEEIIEDNAEQPEAQTFSLRRSTPKQEVNPDEEVENFLNDSKEALLSSITVDNSYEVICNKKQTKTI